MTPGFKARSTPSSHKSSTVFCYRPALIFTTGDHFRGSSNHLSHRAKPRTAKHFGFKYISYLVLTGYVCSSSFDSFAFCLVFKSFLKTCLGKILGKFKSKPFPGNGASYAGYTDRDQIPGTDGLACKETHLGSKSKVLRTTLTLVWIALKACTWLLLHFSQNH